MDLSNTFSLLEVDVEGDREQTTSAADSSEKANEVDVEDDREQTTSAVDSTKKANEVDVEDDREQITSVADRTEKANEVDVEDDREQTTSAADSTEKANGNAKKENASLEDTTLIKNDKGGHQDTTLTKNDKGGHQSVDMLEGDYKLPLVWIDLEMTGLDIEVDRILEIACVITDGKLTKSVEGPDLVIHQTKECLDKMGEWCQDHHAASGLTEKVIDSTISEKEAEQQVIDFVKKHVGTYTPMLAGNSIYVDFIFLKKYMPDLASLFSHVVVDVSSVKALCLRWFPRDNKKAPRKENKHRAMDDIKESIAELKYYKQHLFKSPKSKK